MVGNGHTENLDPIGLAEKLMKGVKEQASKLEKDFAAIGFPIFVFEVVGKTGRSADPKEGSIVMARVKNPLPCVSVFLFSKSFLQSFYLQRYFRELILHFVFVI